MPRSAKRIVARSVGGGVPFPQWTSAQADESRLVDWTHPSQCNAGPPSWTSLGESPIVAWAMQTPPAEGERHLFDEVRNWGAPTVALKSVDHNRHSFPAASPGRIRPHLGSRTAARLPSVLIGNPLFEPRFTHVIMSVVVHLIVADCSQAGIDYTFDWHRFRMARVADCSQAGIDYTTWRTVRMPSGVADCSQAGIDYTSASSG